jgi:HPr kinase/phosphorylase
MAVTVGEFLEAGRESLELEVIAGGDHLNRVIPETSLNRPGLAMAGFFQYFANKRIQVLGLAELTYLKSLTNEERRERLEEFFRRHIAGVVVTRSRRVPREVIELAESHHVPVLRTRMITWDFINLGTLVFEELTSPRLRVQGTMVDILGVGVLVEGRPGIGKSETALALIERGHSLVADDVTVMRRDSSGQIMCSSVDITRYHMEIRGLGIIHVPSLFGVAAIRLNMKLDLIVRLDDTGENPNLDRTGLSPKSREVMGVQVPLVELPVAAGRDLSLIIEVAALNQKLKMLGHDAAKELDEKLIEVLATKSIGKEQR